ncbi:MAG: hypothetical protein EA399_03550 [Desulfovibrionales bacterium]|nr:MAG: hypothetical protein EA399_03550 [Desulfovibrionales bacterium]
MSTVIGLTPMRVFWTVFIVLAVWLQLFVPGSDFFASGIVLCLQQERFRRVLGLTLLAILIQEAPGALAFGAGVLRYGALIGIFFLGRSLFEPRSPVFILLLAIVFTILQLIILHTMAGLQSLSIYGQRLLLEGMIMFCMFVVGWWILDTVYRFATRYASQS